MPVDSNDEIFHNLQNPYRVWIMNGAKIITYKRFSDEQRALSYLALQLRIDQQTARGRLLPGSAESTRGMDVFNSEALAWESWQSVDGYQAVQVAKIMLEEI